MQSYATYGPFYDASQGKRDGSSYLQLLRKHHPRARTLLEIACGTGALLLPLSQHYQVEGLDVSPTMLKYARMKLPRVKLHRQDMTGFQLNAQFDAVICPFDSMNHLLQFKDWIRTFNAVRRHLKPGGVFIFDINTQYRLQALANSPPWVNPFGANYLLMKHLNLGEGITAWDIHVFEHARGKNYRLHREVIKERSFRHQQITTALRARFETVRAYDSNGWSRPKRTSRRVFYVCGVATPEA